MPQTRREDTDISLSKLATLAAAGLLFAGSGAMLAAPPISDLAPTARQAEDDEEEEPHLLTAEQVNLIRVYEIDLDTEPRVRIAQEVLQEFLDDDTYAGRDGMPIGRNEQREFLRWEGWQQLELFFRMRARDYYVDVEVREEPEVLRVWQRQNSRYINRYFLRTFGNIDLGPDVELRYQGRPIDHIPLTGQGRNAEAIAYTNFYVLSQMTANGIPFIDRDHPEESILLQWGIPRADAKFRAPDVENWRPHFRERDTEDPNRDELLNWIEALIDVNQNSQYGIDYLPAIMGGGEEEDNG